MNLDLRSRSQVWLGLFERETYGWLARLSVGIKSAIDIGAAEGEYTLFFLIKTSAGRVFAFEPADGIQDQLNDNLALNRMIDSPKLIRSTKSVGSDTEQECSLDSIAPLVDLPCLVKLDVDGGEAHILRSALKFVASPGIRWIIETHSAALERECDDILKSAGYDTLVVQNAWWRFLIPELRVVEHNRWLVAFKRD